MKKKLTPLRTLAFYEIVYHYPISTIGGSSWQAMHSRNALRRLSPFNVPRAAPIPPLFLRIDHVRHV